MSGVVGGKETDRKGEDILPQIVPILFKTIKHQENKEHLQIQTGESVLCKKKLVSREFLTFLKCLVVSHSTSIQLSCILQ
jgi:hypothetical protein